MIRWDDPPRPLVLDIGMIPPERALDARVRCGCGHEIHGRRDGVTRRQFGAVVLFQVRCRCGSDLTVYGIDYTPEQATVTGPH